MVYIKHTIREDVMSLLHVDTVLILGTKNMLVNPTVDVMVRYDIHIDKCTFRAYIERCSLL